MVSNAVGSSWIRRVEPPWWRACSESVAHETSRGSLASRSTYLGGIGTVGVSRWHRGQTVGWDPSMKLRSVKRNRSGGGVPGNPNGSPGGAFLISLNMSSRWTAAPANPSASCCSPHPHLGLAGAHRDTVGRSPSRSRATTAALPAARCRARTWAGDGGVLGAGAEGRERGGASGRVERSGTGGRGTVARSGKASLQVCARPAQASQNARSLGGTNGCPYEHLGGSGPVFAPFKRVPAGVLIINGGLVHLVDDGGARTHRHSLSPF